MSVTSVPGKFSRSRESKRQRIMLAMPMSDDNPGKTCSARRPPPERPRKSSALIVDHWDDRLP
jgi:hypothetical protein